MSAPPFLKPFWRYYGGKWRAAPHYPAPRFDHIIEPFAGAAGYALRYYQRNVWLIERYPVIAEMWRYLTSVSPAEIMMIPTVDHVDELPGWVPEGARALVGFSMNAAAASPRKALSAGRKQMAAMGRHFEGWTPEMKARVAMQVEYIRHWVIIEADALSFELVNPEATWFIDPPYQAAGHHYVYGSALLDFAKLGAWCQSRRGQVIVCEAEGAAWLPFERFRTIKASAMVGKNVSHEVIWQR